MTKEEIDIAIWNLLGTWQHEKIRELHKLLRPIARAERERLYRQIVPKRITKEPDNRPLSITQYRNLPIEYG